MDFSLSADQLALRELTAKLLGDRCTPEHLTAVGATDDGIDRDLWSAMAKAGLTGIGLPDSYGGGGLGFLEVAIVAEEVARHAAPVPALATMVLGAAPIAALGTEAQRERWLPGVADGTVLLTAALQEVAGDPDRPGCRVDASTGRLHGEKVCAPMGHVADGFVVSTSGGSLYLVERNAPGLSIERQQTTSGLPDARLVLDGTPGERLGAADALPWLLLRARCVIAVMTAGLCDRALRLTAAYAKDRVQFERAIATFQAVSQRAADAYIDTEAIRLTAWQAAWRIDAGLPADQQVLTAKFWASEGGQRVVHAAAHIHGGVGVDRNYPLHRYFLWAKQLELTLGSATPSLLNLGRQLAG